MKTVEFPLASTRKEIVFLLACVAFGAFILPFAIYFVGRFIFGEFGGGGLMDFYGSVQYSLWTLNPVVWFLALAPYLVLSALRLTRRAYRAIQT